MYAVELGISLFSENNRYTLEDALTEMFWSLFLFLLKSNAVYESKILFDGFIGGYI